jgi:outer membrane protein insertion porin family
MGFFEDVNYTIAEDPASPGSLIVTIQVKEKRTGSFSVGVGFDSRSKVTGFLTVAEANLSGTGRRVSASVEVGAQRTFDLGYSNPFIGPRNAAYDVNIYDRRIFREPHAVARVTGADEKFFFEEQRRGGRLNYALPLDQDRIRSVLFGYRNETARLFQTEDIDSPPQRLPGSEEGHISAISTGFLSDRRDLRLDPSRGSRSQVIVEKGISFLGGDSDFTKLDIDLRRYIPLMAAPKPGDLPKAVFAGRIVFGRSFGQLPAFEQYFIGGTDTVRGYDVDEQFGDNQIFSNLELRYRLQRKLQLVGFVDVGSAYGGKFSSSESFDTLFAVGAGVRLQTPIGPIRFDVGKGDRGVRTHFGIGSTF